MVDTAIIVTSVGRTTFLQECLLSVKKQDAAFRCELIVVDNSEKGIKKHVLSLLDKLSNLGNTKYYRYTQCQSASAARNAGLLFISPKVKYIKWLDEDDYFLEISSLSKLLEALSLEEVGFAYGGVVVVDNLGTIIGYKSEEWNANRVLQEVDFPSSGSIFKLKFLSQIGFFSYLPHLLGKEDIDLILRAMLHLKVSGWRSKRISEIVTAYRRSQNSLSFRNDETGRSGMSNKLFKAIYAGVFGMS